MKMLSKPPKTIQNLQIVRCNRQKIVEIIMGMRKNLHANQEIEIRIKIQQKARQPPENRK